MITPIRSSWLITLACFAGLAGSCFAQQQGRLTKVTISAPAGTAAQPFRTSFSQLAIGFSHDGGSSGLFISQSNGADVNSSNFLVNESQGTVGAFFQTAGLKTVSVKVTQSPTGATVESQPTFIVYDNQAPTVTIAMIRVDPRLSYETFVPGKVYHTSADAIGLKGFVNDGPLGTPANQIALTAKAGSASQTSAAPDASGQFEIQVSLAGLPEGPGRITLSAADKMSDNSRPNVGKTSDVQLGE